MMASTAVESGDATPGDCWLGSADMDASSSISMTTLQGNVSTYDGSKSNAQDDQMDHRRDGVYQAMRNHFLMSGKGRRPNLPAPPLTNKLLSQLQLLRDEGSATWKEAHTWFQKLFPQEIVTASQLQHRCQAVTKAVLGLHGQKLLDFLNVNLDFNAVPDVLAQIGLDLSILLSRNDCPEYTPPSDLIPTVSMLLSLESVRSKESLPSTFVYKWMQILLKPTEQVVTKSKILHKLSVAMKHSKTLKLSKRETELTAYLAQPLFETVSFPDVEKSDISVSKNESLKKKEQQKLVLKTQDNLMVARAEIETLKLQNTFLKEERDKLRERNENEMVTRQKQNTLSKGIQACDISLAESKKLHQDIKKHVSLTESQTKEIKLLKDKIKEQQEIISSLKRQMEEKANEQQELITKLKKQVKSEQTMKSNYKMQLSDTIMTSEAILEDAWNEVKDTNTNHVDLKCTGNINNAYSDDVHMTYMALQGEADIAASKCSTAINIVSKYLYKNEIPLKDLPTTQAALNMSSEGHFLSKTQAVESILESDHFTLATDETSRQKRRYLERHIVLSTGGTMSLGFSEIASENAETLLEKSISLFKELCEIYSVEDEETLRESLFKEILSKMKCLMSDRAAVMKLFDKKMAAYKCEVLGSDCSTHFLYCNAHFLLGLSNAAEAALKEIEQDFPMLGRDMLPGKFSRFSQSSETAALRVVRAAAEVLGPRGDEKNGCRMEWLVFLESLGKKSKFSSFRSNRFNNIFDNASALLNHREDILTFLEEQVGHSNLKLQSIVQDVKDENIMAMVSALARINFLFTSPYWSLVNSHKSYGEFPPYVKLMEEFLNTNDPACQSPVFCDFTNRDVDLAFDAEHDTFKKTFSMICLKFKEVLQRQLSDFIGDGVFAGELEQDVKDILLTCPLSNLTGERLFGDLDFDISKRRRASLHLRSSINMWKHNKTGLWLSKKKKKDAIHLLSVARKQGVKIRQRSREEEREVRRTILERLRENDRQKREKELREREKHLQIVNAVLGQGGVCSTKEEVDALLEQGNRVENLKIQIRYRKIVMQETNLSLSGDYAQLYQTLLSSLGYEAAEPPKKKSRLSKK